MGSNDETGIPRLHAAPLNITAANQEEMQTMAYFLRLVATLPGIEVTRVSGSNAPQGAQQSSTTSTVRSRARATSVMRRAAD